MHLQSLVSDQRTTARISLHEMNVIFKIYKPHEKIKLSPSNIFTSTSGAASSIYIIIIDSPFNMLFSELILPFDIRGIYNENTRAIFSSTQAANIWKCLLWFIDIKRLRLLWANVDISLPFYRSNEHLGLKLIYYVWSSLIQGSVSTDDQERRDARVALKDPNICVNTLKENHKTKHKIKKERNTDDNAMTIRRTHRIRKVIDWRVAYNMCAYNNIKDTRK